MVNSCLKPTYTSKASRFRLRRVDSTRKLCSGITPSFRISINYLFRQKRETPRFDRATRLFFERKRSCEIHSRTRHTLSMLTKKCCYLTRRFLLVARFTCYTSVSIYVRPLDLSLTISLLSPLECSNKQGCQNNQDGYRYSYKDSNGQLLSAFKQSLISAL